MTRLALIAALVASPAVASDTWMTSHMSGMQIVPTDAESCVAEVKIRNRLTDRSPTLSGSLVLDDLVVGVSYELNVGPDGAEVYTFIAPDGYQARPDVITVADDTDASVFICPYLLF